jgi:hypothetical protein
VRQLSRAPQQGEDPEQVAGIGTNYREMAGDVPKYNGAISREEVGALCFSAAQAGEVELGSQLASRKATRKGTK